jgi:uncharacterized membrane protein
MRRHPAAIVLVPLCLAIIGARLENPVILLSMVASICIVIILVAFDMIGEKAYPLAVYSIGLAMLFQVTLFSDGLIGTDIHLEYYLARLSGESGWDSSLPYPQNSALGVTLLLPFLAKSFGISLLWLFKVLVPVLFALVPLILYRVFREWVTPKRAFLAAVFFIAVPTYFMELPGLARQQLAEVFLALAMLIILVAPFRLRVRLPLAVLVAVLAVLNHYSTGILLVYFLGGGFIAQAILRIRSEYRLWAMGLTAVIVAGCALGYYGNVGGGAPLKGAMAFLPTGDTPAGEARIFVDTDGDGIADTLMDRADAADYLPYEIDTSYLGRHEPLIRTAMGLDFMDVSAQGKVFRILQYATQIFLVAGAFLMWRRRKGFYIFAPVAALLLALCLFWPGFSGILNATRFYHIALFALAPTFVIGGVWLLRSEKALAAVILVPYLLFTTGFVFEATSHETIDSVDIPYSVSLSNHRLDLGGSITDSDRLVADYIARNGTTPVFADFYGYQLLQESFGMDSMVVTLDRDLEALPSGSYVFLRERNESDKLMTRWAGVGMRRITPYIENPGTVIYSAGNAKLVEIE